MPKFFGPMCSVSRVTVESQAIKSNMLGDPSARVVDVYLPAGHDGRGLPLLVNLVGFTSSGLSQTNWVGFRENLPEPGRGHTIDWHAVILQRLLSATMRQRALRGSRRISWTTLPAPLRVARCSALRTASAKAAGLNGFMISGSVAPTISNLWA
jgi:hypothetical protein